jgi:hypothetical protein
MTIQKILKNLHDAAQVAQPFVNGAKAMADQFFTAANNHPEIKVLKEKLGDAFDAVQAQAVEWINKTDELRKEYVEKKGAEFSERLGNVCKNPNDVDLQIMQEDLAIISAICVLAKLPKPEWLATHLTDLNQVCNEFYAPQIVQGLEAFKGTKHDNKDSIVLEANRLIELVNKACFDQKETKEQKQEITFRANQAFERLMASNKQSFQQQLKQ